MTKVKCKYCGKKIDEALKKCPKCHRTLISNKKNCVKILLYGLWVLMQVTLCFLLYFLGKSALYSGYSSDLFIIGILAALLIVNSTIMTVILYKDVKAKLFKLIIGVFVILFWLFALVYSIKIGKALFYDNSNELLILANRYELNVAKDIKDEIERVFEYDNKGIFSRDVIISNFYSDGDVSNLYIDDSYGNYKLKFYVYMNEFKIKDVYWEFDGHNLYLVKDGDRTDNFEFYYAMNIVNSVFGGDIKGLAKLEDDIEEKIKNMFGVTQNIMFNYEELNYHSSNNSFTINGNLYNVNFYQDMSEEKFVINFTNRYDKKDKRVWYYGDSSFDYVNWNVNV